MSDRRVDVVIPVRDGGALLQQAVDSVLAQEGVDVRVLVVDDGSTDGAPQKLHTDSRLTVLPAVSTGIVAAIQQGFEAGDAPYVARQDADDVSLPGRLQAQVEHLEALAGIGLVGTSFEVLVGERIVTTVRTGPWNVLRSNPFCAGSVMVRRSIWCQAGGVRRVPFAEDYDLWLRCAEISGVTILPYVGYRYRLHADMSSLRHAYAQALSARAVQAAARARLIGAPDPLAQGLDQGLIEESPEVLAWWAREFASLGAHGDAEKLRRDLDDSYDTAAPATPQAAWS